MDNDRGALHHVEWQVQDLDAAIATWGWLVGELDYTPYQQWDEGISWIRGSTYLVIVLAPRDGAHDRRRAGLSHLAFHLPLRSDVDWFWDQAPEHGWSRLYADRHPYAGGPGYYAAYLEDGERFKVELVARD